VVLGLLSIHNTHGVLTLQTEHHALLYPMDHGLGNGLCWTLSRHSREHATWLPLLFQDVRHSQSTHGQFDISADI
jgi:hypothetical protein